MTKQKRNWGDAIAVALLPATTLFFLHVVFIAIGMYEWYQLPWWDIPMHILGGVCIAWGSWALITFGVQQKLLPKLPIKFGIFAVIASVALIGVLWEFMEFGLDLWRAGGFQGGVVDTMKDLFNDLLGSVIFVLIIRRASDKLGSHLPR